MALDAAQQLDPTCTARLHVAPVFFVVNPEPLLEVSVVPSEETRQGLLHCKLQRSGFHLNCGVAVSLVLQLNSLGQE